MTQRTKNFSGLILGWLWAGIPLVWGVTQTAFKAKALFH